MQRGHNHTAQPPAPKAGCCPQEPADTDHVGVGCLLGGVPIIRAHLHLPHPSSLRWDSAGPEPNVRLNRDRGKRAASL